MARLAMERAVLRAGEICPKVPRTFGDTLVHVSDFDCLVKSEESPIRPGKSIFPDGLCCMRVSAISVPGQWNCSISEISQGGRTIVALPGRNRAGRSNILLSVKNFSAEALMSIL